MVSKQEINHGNNPVLRWQIGNVQIKEDSNNGKWVHKTASTGKIDGIVAMLNAVCAWMHEMAGVEETKPKVRDGWTPLYL